MGQSIRAETPPETLRRYRVGAVDDRGDLHALETDCPVRAEDMRKTMLRFMGNASFEERGGQDAAAPAALAANGD